MNILLVAATENEFAGLNKSRFSKHHVEFLVSGIGMVATSHSVTRELITNRYDLAINIGIAGSFDRILQIGEVVQVTEETFSELGAEDGNAFLTLNDLGLEGTVTILNDEKIFSGKLHFKKVRGITVNTVHGNETGIDSITKRLNPQVETMEGGAFFYVCKQEKIPAIQIRAVSNYVERRNKKNWNIPLALNNLGIAVTELISQL